MVVNRDQKTPRHVFHNLLLFGWFFSKFNTLVKEKGLQSAMVSLLKLSGDRVVVEGLTQETFEILKKHPVLLVTRHPLVPVVATLPFRSDIFIVVTSELMGMGNAVAKFFIPIYVRNLYKEYAQKSAVKLSQRLHLAPEISKEEEHARNLKSIDIAKKRIQEGSLIIMVPEGLREDGQWFLGIGFLVKGVAEVFNGYYVPVHVTTAYKKHLLGMVPLLNNFFLSYTVSFGKPTRLTSYRKENDVHILTKKLQDSYDKWAKTLAQ